jgi:hypothetical protein
MLRFLQVLSVGKMQPFQQQLASDHIMFVIVLPVGGLCLHCMPLQAISLAWSCTLLLLFSSSVFTGSIDRLFCPRTMF